MATIGVSTSLTSVGPSGNPDIAFSNFFCVGQTPWGIPNIYQICTSFSDFLRLYGGLKHVTSVASGTTADTFLTITTATVQQTFYAVKSYFEEKGAGPGVLYFCRVIKSSGGATAASKTFTDGVGVTTITSKMPGLMGGTTQITITNPHPMDSTKCLIYVKFILPDGGTIEENWAIGNATDASNASKKSQLVTIALAASGSLPSTAAASKLHSGSAGTADAYDAADSDLVGTTTAAGVKSGLDVFKDERLGTGFVAVPGKYSSTVRNGIKSHCDSYFRMGLLGPPSALVLNTVTGDISTSSTNGNLFYTWPQVYVSDVTSSSGGAILIDNVGPVAGLSAKLDGVYRAPHKSPAGVGHPFSTVLDVERTSSGAELVDDSGSATLADSYINTIRVKATGIVGWGLRTRATDERFRQINSARVTELVWFSCRRLLEKFVMEPITPRLMAAAKGELDAFFEDLHSKGALYGTKPGKEAKRSDAWFVVCDKGNNPDIKVGAGILTADVSFVATPNAERIDLNIFAAAPGFATRSQG